MDSSEFEKMEEDLILFDEVLSALFQRKLLTYLECRKIAFASTLIERLASVYQILHLKNPKVAANILEILKNSIHPLQNITILIHIFGLLNSEEIKYCGLVCRKWNLAALSFNSTNLKRCANADANFIREKLIEQISILAQLPTDLDMNTILKYHHNLLPRHYATEQLHIVNKLNHLAENRASIIQLLLSKNENECVKLMKVVRGKKKNDNLSSIGTLYRDSTFNLKNYSESFKPVVKKMGQVTGLILNVPKPKIISDIESCVIEKEIEVENLLQNKSVLSRIFSFLSLYDVKNCRLVCIRWNSAAEPILGKQSVIEFNIIFRLSDFLNVYKYPSLSDQPFENFSFNIPGLHFTSPSPDTESFFHKCGHSIKYLDLKLSHMDCSIASSCCSHTVNLTELHLKGSGNVSDVKISWKIFLSIKILVLKNIIAKIDKDCFKERMTPLKIELENIKFLFNESKSTDAVTINDFVDFSKSKEIIISSLSDEDQIIFDWTRDIIDADKIIFQEMDFIHLTTSKAKIKYFKLSNCCFLESASEMQIKQMVLKNCTSNLFLLPPTIEKLWVIPDCNNSRCMYHIENYSESLEIFQPHLTFLSFESGHSKTSGVNSRVISWFAQCLNLYDLDLKLSSQDLDVEWSSYVPKSVKRLQVEYYFTFDEINKAKEYEDGMENDWVTKGPMIGGSIGPLSNLCVENLDDNVEIPFLDVLILQDDLLTIFGKEAGKFKSRFLVLTLTEISGLDPMNVFITFILNNKKYEEVLVHFSQGVGSVHSYLTKYVDSWWSSAYYLFIDQRGEAITKESFEKFKLPFKNENTNPNVNSVWRLEYLEGCCSYKQKGNRCNCWAFYWAIPVFVLVLFILIAVFITLWGHSWLFIFLYLMLFVCFVKFCH